MATHKILSSAEEAELRQLFENYVIASAEAAKALKTDPPYHRLEGDALKRFLEKDEVVARIVRRIKEIQGE